MSVAAMGSGGTVRLGDIAELFSGLTPTGARDAEPGLDGVPVVMIKDVGERIAAPSGLDEAGHGLRERYGLSVGDVVVTARSTTVRAAVVEQGHPASGAILGSNLLAIRVRAGSIAPQILAAYLRLPPTQDALLARRKGATVPGVSIRDLARLELSLPTPGGQAALARILALSGSLKAALTEAIALRDLACSELIERALAPDGGDRR